MGSLNIEMAAATVGYFDNTPAAPYFPDYAYAPAPPVYAPPHVTVVNNKSGGGSGGGNGDIEMAAATVSYAAAAGTTTAAACHIM
jgi:hypothetical protein